MITSEIIGTIKKVAAFISQWVNACIEKIKSLVNWVEEKTVVLLQLPKFRKQRNTWVKQEITKALNAHKKGNPLYLSHKVINRKPKQNFARSSL